MDASHFEKVTSSILIQYSVHVSGKLKGFMQEQQLVLSIP